MSELSTSENPLEPDQRLEEAERTAILEEIQTSLDVLALSSEALELHRWLTVTGESFSPVELAAETQTLRSNPETVLRHITCSFGGIGCLIEPRKDGSYEFRMEGTESAPDNPFHPLLQSDPEELPPVLNTLVLTVSAAIAEKAQKTQEEPDASVIISEEDFNTLFLSIIGAADELDVPVIYSFRSECTVDDGRVIDVMATSDMAGIDGHHLPDSDKPYQMLCLQVVNEFRFDREVEFREVSEKFIDDRQIEGENLEERVRRRKPRQPSIERLRDISTLLSQAREGIGSLI